MTTAGVITFVSHTNKPGGAELALRRYIEATSLPVRLVTMEDGGVWDGLAADVLPARGVLGLRSVLLEGGLVVANSMRAAFLTALVMPRQGRLVYWVRDGLTDSAMSPLALALTKYLTARRARHYLANSAWTAQTVHETLGIQPDLIDVVHSMCGVTEERLQHPPRATPHTPLRLLFLGRISPWKAPDVAVRTLEPLRQLGIEARLTIAGGAHFDEGKYVERLQGLVDAEPAASMLGHVNDVQNLLDSHDVLVHCSTVPEPFGQVIVQALGTGIPVIATDHGGPVEILRTGSPFLRYRPGDPEALAHCIASIVPIYAEVGGWGLKRAAAYSDSSAVRRTDSLLRALTSPGRSKR